MVTPLGLSRSVWRKNLMEGCHVLFWRNPGSKTLQNGISQTIQERQSRHAEHCGRCKDLLLSDVFLWTTRHGHTRVGLPAMCGKWAPSRGITKYDVLLRRMPRKGDIEKTERKKERERERERKRKRERERERVKDICAVSLPWWKRRVGNYLGIFFCFVLLISVNF